MLLVRVIHLNTLLDKLVTGHFGPRTMTIKITKFNDDREFMTTIIILIVCVNVEYAESATLWTDLKVAIYKSCYCYIG